MEMASRKIQTYQNKAKNLCTIYFVFALDGECKFNKSKHHRDEGNMFFLAATLVGRIGGDFLQKGGSQEHYVLIFTLTGKFKKKNSGLLDCAHPAQCRINHVADVANATGFRPRGGGLRK